MGTFIDLTGRSFNRLTVVSRAKNKDSRAAWNCICECGKNLVVDGKSLRRGQQSCGCVPSTGRPAIDLTGQTFTYLTVISRASNIGTHVTWKCQCKCGTVVVVASNDLRRKREPTRSCGCWNRERSTSHGLTNHPLFKHWSQMVQRCTNPNYPRFHDYGGRGITVCNQWFNDPAQFFADIGGKPTPDHSVDRIDNNGNYTPDNCKWSTREEQMNNKRNNVIYTAHGKTLTLSQWSRELNTPRGTLQERLARGWSVGRTLVYR